jgi:hypothetical protein
MNTGSVCVVNQQMIVERSKALAIDHQIIFATSQIAPELDTQEFVVGDTISTEKKSLKVHL